MTNKRSVIKRTSGCIFPNYRWCGPGCSGPGKPINDVDACCMRHDQCLKNGGSSCRCDEELINCLGPKMNTYTRKGRSAELMFYAIKLKILFTCK